MFKKFLLMLEESSQQSQHLLSIVNSFANSIKSKYDITSFDLSCDNRLENVICLESIEIPRKYRGRGVGTKIMNELIDFADKYGLLIYLSLADKNRETGTTSKERLRRFYSRFGFVSNRNRNKKYDLSLYASMYRNPIL